MPPGSDRRDREVSDKNANTLTALGPSNQTEEEATLDPGSGYAYLGLSPYLGCEESFPFLFCPASVNPPSRAFSKVGPAIGAVRLIELFLRI